MIKYHSHKLLHKQTLLFNLSLPNKTHVKVVSDPHELLAGVDLVSVDLLDGLFGIVHQLKELGGPKVQLSI